MFEPFFPFKKGYKRILFNEFVKKVIFVHFPCGFSPEYSYIIFMKILKDDPFWERVKKLTKAHKISLEKFAEHVDVSYNTLKSWIRYNRIPDAYTSFDIAVALGVSVEYLVTGADGKASEIREREALTRKTAAAAIKKMTRLIRENAKLIG